MAAVSRDAFHEAAAATGDLRAIAAYFAQPHVAADVDRVNAFFRGRVPTLNIFGDGPADPWYFTVAPHDQWQLPGSHERTFIFTTAIARGLNHVVEWFYAPEQIETFGETLAALLPFTGALAADENQLDIVETLLSSQAFMDRLEAHSQQQVLNEMLSVAVERSHPEMIELLLAHGAHVNPVADHGRDHPLASCASTGNEASVSTLVRNGAFVVGASLLIHSSYLGNIDAASALLKHGVDWGNHSGDFNPLHAAAEEGHTNLVSLYFNEGFADIDAQNSRGETALMMVAWQGSGERGLVSADAAEAVTRVLISHGADFEIRDHDQSTALHHAIGTEYTPVVSLLLETGADPNARNLRGDSPLDTLLQLDLAEEDDYIIAQVELLVEHGAQLLEAGPGGTSTLHRLRQSHAVRARFSPHTASVLDRGEDSRRHSV